MKSDADHEQLTAQSLILTHWPQPPGHDPKCFALSHPWKFALRSVRDIGITLSRVLFAASKFSDYWTRDLKRQLNLAVSEPNPVSN